MRRLAILFILSCSIILADNWPQWRGPNGNGVSSESGVPVTWSTENNVAWKVPISGWGNSTPVVWGDRIFMTAQIGDGPIDGEDFEGAAAAERSDPAASPRFVVKALSKADGALLWEKTFTADKDELPVVHVKHNLASPSCVTDGERVYAWFGTGLAVAFTMDGEELWRRHLGEEYSRFDVRWGHGSSPTLYEDSLLLLVDHPDDSYLLAVDKRSGENIYRAEREGKRSYTTPYVLRREDGDQLLVNTNSGVEAIDPASGETLWSAGDANRVPVGAPVVHDDVIYTNQGYFSSPYMAVRVGKEAGEISWQVGTGGPYVSSLLYYDGLVYMATERGIASAVDAETGETVWKQRLGGVFSASPIAAEGRVYFIEESGKTYVVKAARDYELIAANDLGERSLSSPAVSDGVLLIRTDDHLWAIKE